MWGSTRAPHAVGAWMGVAVGLIAGAGSARGAILEDTLRVAPFGRVSVYRQSEHPPQVVLFVSGDGGWNEGVVDMARELSAMDAMVVGVDITRYLKHLAGTADACSYPASDFEALSQAVQKRFGYEQYVTPILVGYSSGATLVYATLVQAPATTFRGAISLGFCPDLPLNKPFCKGSGLECRPMAHGKGYVVLPTQGLEPPWIALQGMIDEVCDPDSTQAFVAKVRHGEVMMLPKVGHGYSVTGRWLPQFKEAYRKVETAAPISGTESVIDSLPGLPLVEVDATGTPRDCMALHVTGDGGWGVTDRGLSAALAQQGIPVVGLNALRYFWKARTPESTSQDVERILRRYLAKWGKKRIVLIGYSFGADVLPFVAARLPADLRSRIALVALLGLSAKADFHFEPANWLGAAGHDALPVRPEMEQLRGMKILCFSGEKDNDSICGDLPADLVTAVAMKGGHRIGGSFDGIADRILTELP